MIGKLIAYAKANPVTVYGALASALTYLGTVFVGLPVESILGFVALFLGLQRVENKKTKVALHTELPSSGRSDRGAFPMMDDRLADAVDREDVS